MAGGGAAVATHQVAVVALQFSEDQPISTNLSAALASGRIGESRRELLAGEALVGGGLEQTVGVAARAVGRGALTGGAGELAGLAQGQSLIEVGVAAIQNTEAIALFVKLATPHTAERVVGENAIFALARTVVTQRPPTAHFKYLHCVSRTAGQTLAIVLDIQAGLAVGGERPVAAHAL